MYVIVDQIDYIEYILFRIHVSMKPSISLILEGWHHKTLACPCQDVFTLEYFFSALRRCVVSEMQADAHCVQV